MATDFYGSCTGTSKSKYDIWLRVKQNSQNITENKSNVTVTLYLKRNDGYSSSAYNLNADANSVKLSVGGEVKVNKNISIDTRNGVTVTLASWSGDVIHSADGTLNLSVSGSFKMNGTSLTGGSANGSFKCSTIPRKSTLNLSPTSVSPGGAVNVSITSHSNKFSHKLNFKIGGKSKTISVDSSMSSVNFTVPLEWANELTKAASGTITVTLTTYNGSVSVGSRSYNLSFKIPQTEEYLPDFTLAVSRVDNSVPADWGVYLKGVSEVKVSVENTAYKYGASYSSCTITVDDLSMGNLSGTFSLSKAGNITVKATVKDSRGFKVTKTQTINVLDYSPPSVSIGSVRRCNENGELNIYGTSLLVEYNTKFSSVDSKNNCNIYGRFKQNQGSVYSESETLSGTGCILFKNLLSISNSYTLSFFAEDLVTGAGAEVIRYISSSNIPFNIKKGGNGAAFGRFAENDDELSVGWNLTVDKKLKAEGGIEGTLYYETISYELTENAEELVGRMRYYPSLSLAHINIRIKVKNRLTANTQNDLLCVKDILPSRFTPLEEYANGDDTLFCKGGLYSNTGMIVIAPNKDVSVGRYIYINGFYLVYN